MKKTHKYYLIFDPRNKLFWERTYFYGHGKVPIFCAQFTEDLQRAKRISKREAKEALINLSDLESTVTDSNADLTGLEIKPVYVTIDMPLKLRWCQ